MSSVSVEGRASVCGSVSTAAAAADATAAESTGDASESQIQRGSRRGQGTGVVEWLRVWDVQVGVGRGAGSCKRRGVGWRVVMVVGVMVAAAAERG